MADGLGTYYLGPQFIHMQSISLYWSILIQQERLFGVWVGPMFSSQFRQIYILATMFAQHGWFVQHGWFGLQQ